MNKALFVVPLIFISLALAIWSGWLRMGWSLPVTPAAAHHGSMMVGCFLATLIFLERAVTFKSNWVLLLPVINGVSGLLFAINQPIAAQLCLLAGSAGFFAMCVLFIYKYKELYYYVFLAGAFCLFVGQVVLFSSHLYAGSVGWWIAFLLFTIVAERLELSRFLPLSKVQRLWLLIGLACVLISLFIQHYFWGHLLFSASILNTAVWLLKNDMARRSVRLPGQHKYSAILLLTGYVWLIVTAILLLMAPAPFIYDAALHSFFIGFVFSMIFSHAPIILPAVLKLPLKIFRPALYVPFMLLQLSLMVRVAGDLAGAWEWRKWGGMLNGLAILIFFIIIGSTLRTELKKRRQPLSKA